MSTTPPVIRIVVADDHQARVLILTTFDLDDYVYDALRAGASDFLLKDVTAERLFDAVRVIAAGDALLAPAVTRRLISEFAVRQPKPQTASHERDRRTHASRDTGVEAARRGTLQPGGCSEARGDRGDREDARQRILSKLGLRDRTQAVVTAYESGLVVPGESRS